MVVSSAADAQVVDERACARRELAETGHRIAGKAEELYYYGGKVVSQEISVRILRGCEVSGLVSRRQIELLFGRWTQKSLADRSLGVENETLPQWDPHLRRRRHRPHRRRHSYFE
jgi:hypothetical protein